MERTLTIDARWLEGGLGTYTRQLLAGLAKQNHGFAVHAIVRRQDAALIEQWCNRVTVVDAHIYSLREQIEIAREARGCSLLHVPHYNAPLFHRGPLLLSIHDIIHITDPASKNSAKAWMYARPVLQLAARKAEHIVTVSDYSRAQIIERIGISPSKVSTIYNGVNGRFSKIDRQEAAEAVYKFAGVRSPYILYVGNLKPHKNVSRLLQAYAVLRKRIRAAPELLIVGDDARFRKALLEERLRLGIQDSTYVVPFVPEELLPQIYAAAEVLVMPSRIEGFGLPVLEAMSCGTPVICSRAASLPEVGGDAVLYFDHSSTEELAATLQRLLESTDLQESSRVKGLERAKGFTLEESVRKHVQVYRRLLALD
jgi:glycosyltransferase involved in cell wall biosynthesis